jgi:hypothetical protein
MDAFHEGWMTKNLRGAPARSLFIKSGGKKQGRYAEKVSAGSAIASRKSRERKSIRTCSPSRLAPCDFRFLSFLFSGQAMPGIQALFLQGKDGYGRTANGLRAGPEKH